MNRRSNASAKAKRIGNLSSEQKFVFIFQDRIFPIGKSIGKILLEKVGKRKSEKRTFSQKNSPFRIRFCIIDIVFSQITLEINEIKNCSEKNRESQDFSRDSLSRKNSENEFTFFPTVAMWNSLCGEMFCSFELGRAHWEPSHQRRQVFCSRKRSVVRLPSICRWHIFSRSN